MSRPLLTAWDLKRFAAYEALAVSATLLVPGYWVYVPWTVGMALLYALARRHLRRHPEPAAPQPGPWWLTLVVLVGVTAVVSMAVGATGLRRDPGTLIVAIGCAVLLDRAADRWWAHRSPDIRAAGRAQR
jgi:hypothetical protein